MARAWLVLGILALTTSAWGCSSCKGSSDTIDAGGASDGPTALLTPEEAAKVIARVGDTTITLGDFVAALEHMDQFERIRYQSPERRKELLEEMIQVTLLAQEAKEKGYDQDPLAQQELRMILRDALLAEARKGAPMPDAIPEEEVRAYYEAHKADYRDPERRRLSLIVLRDEATAARTLEAARKAPDAARWGELVRSRSIDPQAKANVPIDLAGDVGFVSPPGDPRGGNARVPEEVRAAAFEIPAVGDVLGRVVKAGDRFYIVRLTQKSEPRERAFAEAERAIRVKLSSEKMQAKEDELLAELRKEFPVHIDEAALEQVRVELPSDASVE